MKLLRHLRKPLSVILAFVMTFSSGGGGFIPTLTTVETVYAAESFDSMKLDFTKKDDASGRVTLNSSGDVKDLVTGPVIDSFEYKSDRTDLLTVDPDTGAVELLNGATFAEDGEPGIPVTITADVEYYKDDDTLFHEDFEEVGGGLLTTTEKLGSGLELSDVMPRLGSKAVTPTNTKTNVDPAGTNISLPSGSNYRMGAWYYDSFTDGGLQGAQTMWGITNYANSNNAFVGVMYESAQVAAKHNPTVYSFASKGSGVDRWISTGVTRTKGWHRIEWLIDSTGATLYIDGEEIPASKGTATHTQMKSGGSVAPKVIGGWNNRDGIRDYVAGKHFVDDFYIVKDTDAVPAQKTLTVNVIPAGGLSAIEITSHPLMQRVNDGETAAFSVTATGDGIASYQWYVCDDEKKTNFAKIDGATSKDLSLAAVNSATQQAKFYYCDVISTEGAVVTSNAAPLVIVTTAVAPNDPGTPVLNTETGIYTGQNNYGDIVVTLLKDGSVAGYYLSKNGSGETNHHERHNVLPYARALGVGTYTVRATVINYGNNVSSDTTADGQLIIEKLDAPEELGWNGSFAKWDAVNNASAYAVQLYRSSVKEGSPVSASGTSVSLTAVQSADTFKVKAIGGADTRFLDSDESDESSAYSLDLALISRNGTLRAGESERLIVDTPSSFVADKIEFTVESDDESKIEVDGSGNVTVKDGYVPTENEEVTVNVSVDYYNLSDTLFYDGFEGDKKFTANADAYDQSDVNSRTGIRAATPNGKDGVAAKTSGSISSPTGDDTTVVTAWYYDDGLDLAGHAAFGFAPYDNQHISVNSGNTNADWEDHATHYSVRLAAGGQFYPVNVERSKGWHKFQWFVTSTETTYKIDDQDLMRQTSDGGDFDTAVKHSTPRIGPMEISTNWGGKIPGSPINTHFVDDVYVLDSAKSTQPDPATAQVTIKLLPKEYTHSEDSVYVLDSEDYEITVNPDLVDLQSVEIGGEIFTASEYEKTERNLLTIKKEAFSTHNIEAGVTEIKLTFDSDVIEFDINTIAMEKRNYYFSNDGDDSNSGRTEDEPLKSISIIDGNYFMPGSNIYLDAESTWDLDGDVIRPKGSGTEGEPITIQKYNDGGDPNQRPIINGGGTGTNPTGFPTLGAVDIFDVSYWEISGLEVTNIGSTSANGRSGISVRTAISDLPQSQFNMTDYANARMQGIVIRDCYVHDVNGRHQQNGAEKVAGGIIMNGWVDVLVENCKTLRCDNEGIRNNAYGPSSAGNSAGLSWNNSAYVWASDAVFRNNWVEASTGDGIVMSGGLNAVVERNYITDCGYSYLSDTSGNLRSNYASRTKGDAVYSGTKNYAAAWIMGSKGTVFRYNESVDNPYRAISDGMAWDIDMYSLDNLYEYNYSRNNHGGFYLQMNATKGNTVRYNISINDGESPGFNKANNSLILLCNGGSTSEENSAFFYNNLIVTPLKDGDSNTALFDSGNNNLHTYFQNNIVAYTGEFSSVPLKGGGTSAPFIRGRFTNNIIYPENIFGNLEAGSGYLGAEVTASDNVYVNEEKLEQILKDYTSAPEGFIADAGTEDAELDYSIMEGFKLADGDNIAYGKGAEIVSTYVDRMNAYDHVGEPTDFFGNPLSGTPSIGAHNPYGVTFDSNGGSAVPTKYADQDAEIEAPEEPVLAEVTFNGWFTDDETFAQPWDFDSDIVTENMTLYAKWGGLVPVTDITGLPKWAEINTPLALSGTVTPDTATKQDISWAVKDLGTTGATITDGIFTATTEGTATITATIANGLETGDYTKEFTITVVTEIVDATGVTLDKTAAAIAVGGTEKLTATVEPDTATDRAVTWSSSDEAVATVDADGLVKAITLGTANITVTTVDGGKTAVCAVTVGPAVTSVALEETATITVGGTKELTAKVSPDNAANKNVTWASNDETIATVDSAGVVTGVAKGTAKITVTTEDGSKTAFCTVTVSEVAVKSVSLNKSSTSIIVEGTEPLTATVSPENAANKDVTWSSDNEAVATVSQTGLVTGVAKGTAKITVTTVDGEYTAECTVTVSEDAISVTSVSLNKSTAEIDVGKTETLKATINPPDATNQNITWSSDNEKVATVDSAGVVTGVAKGTAKITVKTEDGGYTVECTVTVSEVVIPVESVSLNKSTTEIDVDETEILTATVNPTDATNKNVTWASDDTTVATVTNDGVVKGIAPGTATITVTTEDGNKTDECEVTVSAVVIPPDEDDDFYFDLSGLVTDSLTSNIVSGTAISVYFDMEATHQAYGTTNKDDGTYIFEKLPNGTYYLVAKAKGYYDEGPHKAEGNKDGVTLNFVMMPLEEEPPLPPAKSSDAALKSLSISRGSLKPAFSADVLNYTVSLGNSYRDFTVNALANHEKATVTGAGNYNLSVGSNIVTLTVTAEDGTVRQYKITVSRASASNSNNNNGSSGGSSSGGSSSSGSGSTPTTPSTPAADPQVSNPSAPVTVRPNEVVTVTDPTLSTSGGGNAADTTTTDTKVSIAIGANDKAVEIPSSVVNSIAGSNKSIVVSKAIISYEMTPNFVQTEGLGRDAAVQVVVAEPSKEVVDLVTQNLKGRDEALNRELLSYVYNLNVKNGEDYANEFTTPLKVSFDLSGFEMTPAQAENLTIVKFVDGNPVYLGGVYDPETGTLSTDTMSVGDGQYAVISAADLLKVELTIGETDYKTNAQPMQSDVAPERDESGYTFVPVRLIAEALGAEVGWDEASSTVTLSLDGKTSSLVIGQTGPGLDAPAKIVDGRTMVPLRYISESLGANVVWNDETESIGVFKQDLRNN